MDFFQRATYKGTYVEAVEFRQGWSVAKNKGDVKKKRRRPRKVVCRHKKGTLRRFKKRKRSRKARRWLPRRQGSVCPQPRNFFFGSRVLGSERPVLFDVSAPTRLKSTRKPCAKEVPETDYLTQQEQFLNRTTLRRLKIPLRM